MRAHAITMEVFADINDAADVSARIDLGAVMLTTGRHRDLGVFTIAQDIYGVVILAETPIAIMRAAEAVDALAPNLHG